MLSYIYYIQAYQLEKNKKWKLALVNYQKAAKKQKKLSTNLAYRIGFVAEKLKDWKTAELWLKKAVDANPTKAQWVYRLALAQEMNKKFAFATDTYAKAIELQPKNSKYFHRQGKALLMCGKAENAELAFQQAQALEPSNALYAYELALAIRKQGRTWQEVEALQAALALDPANAQWLFELGDAQDKMNHFAEAGQAFAQANALQPGNAIWHFREGWAWERAEDQSARAEAAYTTAISADKELKSKDFGVGVFHQQRGFWPQAAQAYALTAKEKSGSALPELYYRMGLAHDRCYEWQQAVQSYRRALVLDPHKPEWHYRLGFVLERLECWQEAAQAYEYAATTRSTHTPYWFYRLGYVLEKIGNYENACHAFLNTRTQGSLDSPPLAHIQTYLSNDYQEKIKASILAATERVQEAALHSSNQAEAFYKIGNQAERLQLWDYAAKAYRAAVVRNNQQNTLWYYRLGYVLVQMGEVRQAASAFLDTRIFKQPHGVDMTRYEKDAGLMQVMKYTEYLETLAIQKKTILYESFLGASLGCNPYAIYKSIVDSPDFREFTHIWVITNEAKLPFDFIPRENTVLINRQSNAYLRYIATAEYLINNVTFPSWFIRREDQKYLNTWHGTPLKGLGKDMPGEFMVHGNVTRNFLHATHLISPNTHTSDAMMKSYDVAGIFDGMLAETGYPRIDSTLNTNEFEREKIKNKLGLNKNAPIVLYAPTWRGVQGSIETDVERLLNDISKLCSENYQLVFRGHHFIEKSLKDIDLPVAIASQDIDANYLLSIADVLITDYSSIFFDFLPTKRPIIYYAYDLEEYSAVRGLYFPLETMPGALCRSLDEVLQAVMTSLSGSDRIYDDKYQSAIGNFARFEDGKSTQRVIDFFFKGARDHLVTRYNESRAVVLFYNGQFIPNGITSSFLNLVNNIPKDEFLISIAIEPSNIKNDAGRMSQFELIPKNLRILPRDGRTLFTPEEVWVDNIYMSLRGVVTGAIHERYKKIYEREFIRMYGNNNRIVRLVNFEGYSGFWMQVFAHAGSKKHNITWLHNDMLEEYRVRMPHLTRNFMAYKSYKKIISVSSTMNDINKKSLIDLFDIKEDKFSYCENSIDFEKIFNKSNEPLDEDLQPWFEGTVFLTIGRMSPEKDQEKLIRAFANVKRHRPEPKLVILGDGPLRKHLDALIEELGMQKEILLAGQRLNPFAALKACDCFVLSSNHEGQPMVLLEALTLGKKIIATDINGNRGILAKYNGTLVENSISGLENGIIEFLDGKIENPLFDVDSYQDSAIRMFIENIE